MPPLGRGGRGVELGAGDPHKQRGAPPRPSGRAREHPRREGGDRWGAHAVGSVGGKGGGAVAYGVTRPRGGRPRAGGHRGRRSGGTAATAAGHWPCLTCPLPAASRAGHTHAGGVRLGDGKRGERKKREWKATATGRAPPTSCAHAARGDTARGGGGGGTTPAGRAGRHAPATAGATPGGRPATDTGGGERACHPPQPHATRRPRPPSSTRLPVLADASHLYRPQAKHPSLPATADPNDLAPPPPSVAQGTRR